MTSPRPSGQISARVGEDPRFQRRMWRAERAAWVAMLLMIMLGLSGGLGDGWLASRVAASPSGAATVAYDRIMRWSVEYELRAATRSGPSVGDAVLDPSLLAGLRVTAKQGGSGAAEHVIWVTPRNRFGRVSGTIRLGEGDGIPLDILILP